MVTAIKYTVEYRPVRVVDLLATTGEMSNCEYCGREIRYQHCLQDDSGGRLNTGVECARNLCDGYDGTEDENRLRNRAHKRQNWLNVRWGTSQKGNAYRVVTWAGRKYVVTVFRYADKWRSTTGYRYVIHEDGKDNPLFPDRTYDSEDASKMAAFDRLCEVSGM